MAKFVFLSVLSLFVLSSANAEPAKWDQQLTQQISTVLKEATAIQRGMTRGDLLKIFEGGGGLSTPDRRTYVYRRCPLIQVNVEFELAKPDRDANGRMRPTELAEDVIIYISRPYLAPLVGD